MKIRVYDIGEGYIIVGPKMRSKSGVPYWPYRDSLGRGRGRLFEPPGRHIGPRLETYSDSIAGLADKFEKELELEKRILRIAGKG